MSRTGRRLSGRTGSNRAEQWVLRAGPDPNPTVRHPQANGVPVEGPVQALVELGVDAEELTAPHRFLLFGGQGGVRGGARDLIATYDSEALARTAFIDLRRSDGAGWAELVALAPRGGVKRLAWSGPRAADLQPVPPTDSVRSRERSRSMQATETFQDPTRTEPVPGRPRLPGLRLIVAAVLAAAAAGVAGAHALTHPSSPPAPVVGPARSRPAIDTGDGVVRPVQQPDGVSRTTAVSPDTHAPLDASADQAQYAGSGGDG